MRLDLQFILDSISQEKFWKPGDQELFFFDDWNLSLKREEDKYFPFIFAVHGHKQNSNETIGRRYTSMEKAFLHILNLFNENVYLENKFKSLSDIIEKFPEKHGLHFVDSYNIEEQNMVYSVSLEPGYIVEVKGCTATGFVYVMQNHDGSTVHGEVDNDITFPDYRYNVDAVIGFVKDKHMRRKWQIKPSLTTQIQSASIRTAEFHPSDKSPAKETAPER